MKPRAIVTDIEGTTSSIAFVKDVLFPYAAQQLPDFLREHVHEPAVAEQLDTVRREIGEPNAALPRLTETLLQWMAEDRKATPLKALQGMIWKHGYESGAYRAHVYPDAVEALRHWHAQGIPLHVYSSGSIAAQKLFFAHTEAGDLTKLFSGYFDTTSGPKQQADSYRSIAQAIGEDPANLLFLSDVEKELDAAREAGWQTTWLVRPQDNPQSDAELAKARHPWVRDFFGLLFD